MCKKTEYKTCNTRIDKCIKPLIKWLQDCGYSAVASCCGHNKYPITVVVQFSDNGQPFYRELFSGIEIPRTSRFYKRDDDGYFYIPELNQQNKNSRS